MEYIKLIGIYTNNILSLTILSNYYINTIKGGRPPFFTDSNL